MTNINTQIYTIVMSIKLIIVFAVVKISLLNSKRIQHNFFYTLRYFVIFFIIKIRYLSNFIGINKNSF